MARAKQETVSGSNSVNLDSSSFEAAPVDYAEKPWVQHLNML